jgi:uncharacterized protein (TIGR03083 family)
VHIQALRSSVERLQALATALTEDQLTGRAYPTDWTAAQVLSHFGSGAVIMARQLEDALAGHATRGDFAPSVWDTWNAKSPAAQRDDALAADAALLARIEAVSADQREEFSFAMGPMSFGFEQFVGLRLNEHAFHTWDIEVATDPAATIPAPVAALVSTTSTSSPASPPSPPATQPPSPSPPPARSAPSPSTSPRTRSP